MKVQACQAPPKKFYRSPFARRLRKADIATGNKKFEKKIK
jgi:hypothetical protein